MITSNIIAPLKAALSFSGMHPGDRQFARMFGMAPMTGAGVAVDHETVLALPAVLRGVNVIGNGVGRVPFYVFSTDGENQEWDKTHPAWKAIYRRPNRGFSAREFRKTLTAWALLWGNGIAYIDRPNWPDGPVEFYPLLPDRTIPIRAKNLDIDESLVDSNDLYFQTIIAGETRTFSADDCIHIRGLGGSPYWGYDVVEVLRESFGGVAAGQEFGNRFFGQGANPSGFIEMPGSIGEEDEERFVSSLRKATEGLGKAHRLALLEEGAKFHPWTVDPQKAQFLEGKQYDVRVIAMAIGIKVHKLIDSANSAYASLEQANEEHKDDDLVPWIDAFKDEFTEKLLTEDQKEAGTHVVDIDDEYLSFVPFAERAEGISNLYNNGIVDKEEARDRLNFGRSRSPDGKRYRMPRNIGFEDETIIGSGIGGANASTDADELASSAMAKIAKRLAKQAEAKHSKGELSAWLGSLVAERGPKPIQSSIDSLFADVKASSSLEACIALLEPVIKKGNEDE